MSRNPTKEYVALAVIWQKQIEQSASADAKANIMVKDISNNWRTWKATKMKKITVEISEGHLSLLDELVTAHIFPNRNEAITEAIRDLLKTERKL